MYINIKIQNNLSQHQNFKIMVRIKKIILYFNNLLELSLHLGIIFSNAKFKLNQPFYTTTAIAFSIPQQISRPFTKKRVVGLEPFCVLCRNDGEDIKHLLLTYPFSSHVWTRCTTMTGLYMHTTQTENIWHRIRIDPYKKHL